MVSQSLAFGDGLVIERNGAIVTKVIKNGVVLWPQEPHNAPMLTETQLKELAVAKERVWRQQESAMRANDTMIGGNHYKSADATGNCPKCGSAIEHWDWAHNLRALEYAATKYLARWRDKGGLESLKKVIHYVQKLIEIHFPDVVVTIQYTNRTPGGLGRQQTEGCAGVDEGTAAHQAAIDRRS